MATGYGVCVCIVYEHRAISCTGLRRRTGSKPYRDRAEIVRKSCSHRSERKSYGARAASARRSRGDGTVTVRSSCSFGQLYTKSVQPHISACDVD